MHGDEEYNVLLVQFGATALVYAKILAVLPTTAFVPSVQMSEKSKRQIMS